MDLHVKYHYYTFYTLQDMDLDQKLNQRQRVTDVQTDKGNTIYIFFFKLLLCQGNTICHIHVGGTYKYVMTFNPKQFLAILEFNMVQLLRNKFVTNLFIFHILLFGSINHHEPLTYLPPNHVCS